MRLSDIKEDESMDFWAEILEPSVSILADEKIRDGFRSGLPYLKLVQIALKDHKQECFEILAATERKPVEEYKKECNALTLPKKLFELLNDPEFTSFFSSVAGTDSEIVSGDVMENTKGVESGS